MTVTGLEQVIAHERGPLLVLGGPGTGKTHSLEERFLHLARSPGLAPHRILMLCGNRSYAMEARERLVWSMPLEATVEVPIYTWHALAYHLVTRYYSLLGYREAPVLLTAPEQWGVVRELLASEHPSAWPVWSGRLQDRGFIDEIADFCLRVEQRMVDMADLEALMSHRPDWEEVVRFYDRYRSHLKQQARLDYAGLISSAVALLQQDENVQSSLSQRFPHLLVDDAQEMSQAHLALLARFGPESLTVAADPNSGIETFRGAEPDWVWGFEARFGAHATVHLEQSHRVGSPLLEAAQDLIAFNEPEPSSAKVLPAEHVTTFESRLYSSVAEEAEAIARELRYLHLAEGVAWGEMAILVSQPRYLSAPLERALDRWEVPFHQLTSDRPLSGHPVVAALIDLVRCSLEMDGWESVLPDLLNTGIVGLDYSERRRLEREAWKKGCRLADLVADSPSTAEYRRLRDVVLASHEAADECFWQLYTQSSFLQALTDVARSDPSDPANADLDALVALSHSIGRFVERRHGRGSIGDYLKEAARADFGSDPWLAPLAGPAIDRVSLLSFHSARGRQWDTVVVAGCLDAWVPKGRRAQGLFDPFALEIAEATDREIEAISDDRRTFYVAATRASRRVLFTVSPGPGGRGRPSRFLSELSGAEPQPASLEQRPPLTVGELRSHLRKALASPGTPRPHRAAAVLALAEVPGTDPSRWYGRWDWTEGSKPLAEEGNFRTSYSRLGVYENCGLQYLMQSVLGLDPASTHSMKFGTWIHALFEAVHKGVINDIPTLKAEYSKLFDERIFPNATIAAQFKKDGEKMLRAFWENEFTQDNVLVEHSFEIPFEKATLRGRIDRIDTKGRALKLTDYKTARWTPSTREAQESLQLAIYFLAARTDPELSALGEPALARLVYPGAYWADGSMKVLKQSAEQADEVIGRLPELLKRVMEEDFKPSVTADCFYCKMKPLCPLWPEGEEMQV